MNKLQYWDLGCKIPAEQGCSNVATQSLISALKRLILTGNNLVLVSIARENRCFIGTVSGIALPIGNFLG